MFKAHRLLYHATLGLRVIKKQKKPGRERLLVRNSRATLWTRVSSCARARATAGQKLRRGLFINTT